MFQPDLKHFLFCFKTVFLCSLTVLELAPQTQQPLPPEQLGPPLVLCATTAQLNFFFPGLKIVMHLTQLPKC